MSSRVVVSIVSVSVASNKRLFIWVTESFKIKTQTSITTFCCGSKKGNLSYHQQRISRLSFWLTSVQSQVGIFRPFSENFRTCVLILRTKMSKTKTELNKEKDVKITAIKNSSVKSAINYVTIEISLTSIQFAINRKSNEISKTKKMKKTMLSVFQEA